MDSDHHVLGWHTDICRPFHPNGRSAIIMRKYAHQHHLVDVPRIENDAVLPK
jgi:hypothetical protein